MVETRTSYPTGRPGEVFAAFLKLGLTSFGGPVAHLGYFRDELVARRGWLSDEDYAELVALCQFLPGPASSQVGFALGLMRAGWAGAVAAFLAFTLPSALLLLAFALMAVSLSGPVGTGALHGLKLVAVAIVAQALVGMIRSLCPDRLRASLAVLALALLAVLPGASAMVVAIAAGAFGGLLLLPATAPPAHTALPLPVSLRKGQGVVALAAFGILLLTLPLLADQSAAFAVMDSFYRAGALVFGGGHVVLPLLEAEVVQSGWVTADEFLAGYAAAQAVPGPLFTFAAYLGALLQDQPNGVLGAALALLALFLPGMLLLIGVLPFWNALRSAAAARRMIQGANAAVVGVLGAALYAPVFTNSVVDLSDFAVVVAAFTALTAWRLPPWLVVLASAAAGIALAV